MNHHGTRFTAFLMTHWCNALLLVGTCFVLALTGCQSTPHKSSGGAQQEKLLERVAHWEAEGKIAIQMANDRQSASFKWTQDKADYAIHLFGPFGQGTTWLRRTARGVTLENAKTGSHKAASAEALMLDVLGWQVPVSNLQFWLRGLPANKPRPKNLERDPAGFLAVLHQEGWQVAYSRHEHFSGWWLPTRILAERDDLRLTIVIKRWQLPDAPTAPH
jgi:outer membrane lipoprotein LolB